MKYSKPIFCGGRWVVQMSEHKCLIVIDEVMGLRGYKQTSVSTEDSTTAIPYTLYHNESGDCICVFTKISKGLNVNELRFYTQVLIKKVKQPHCIIIYNGKVANVKINENIRLLKDQNIIVETFHSCELQINITKHRLYQPHHKIVDKDEIAKLKSYPGIPMMKRCDPVVKLFRFMRGDYIKIERFDGSIGYRLVA